MPLNIHGRTCVPAGCLFAVGGWAAVYLVSPAWDSVTSHLTLTEVQIIAFLVVILYTVDFTLTISALTDFARKVKAFDDAFNAQASIVSDRITTTVGPAAAEFVHLDQIKLQEERMQHLLNSMSGATRATLSRVAGLRLPKHPDRPNLHIHAHEIYDRVQHLKRK